MSLDLVQFFRIFDIMLAGAVIGIHLSRAFNYWREWRARRKGYHLNLTIHILCRVAFIVVAFDRIILDLFTNKPISWHVPVLFAVSIASYLTTKRLFVNELGAWDGTERRGHD